MKKHKFLRLGASAVLAVAVIAACSEDDPVTPPPGPVGGAPPPPPPPAAKTQFGAGFEAAFDQDATDEPRDPVAGDIIDIDITADPVDVADP